MGTQHKHAAVIKAWADGAEVQYAHPDMVWHDWQPNCYCPAPTFSKDLLWRIKPQTIKYRVALIRNRDCDDFSAVAADSEVSAKHVESFRNFSRWLTNWVEVEV